MAASCLTFSSVVLMEIGWGAGCWCTFRKAGDSVPRRAFGAGFRGRVGRLMAGSGIGHAPVDVGGAGGGASLTSSSASSESKVIQNSLSELVELAELICPNISLDVTGSVDDLAGTRVVGAGWSSLG